MFERRLKIFMGVLVLVTLGLLSRVFEVQVVAHSYWNNQAAGLLTKTQTTETTRGRILDVHGNPLAVDTACTDVCVDYRAIIEPPEKNWLKEIVAARIRSRLGISFNRAKPEQREAIQVEVLADIHSMWATLAQLNLQVAAGTDRNAAMNDLRKSIIQTVQLRHQWLSTRSQQRDQQRASASSRLMKWLAGSSGEMSSADTLGAIEEEQEAHVILPAVDADAYNFLAKRQEQFPGLSFRSSTHRTYPMNEVACHLLGNLSNVSAGDLDSARKLNLDELRQYQANDVIGRNGIEALCEPLLRGSRGKIEKRVGDDAIVAQQDFVPGSDVRLSIDAVLQQQAQGFLEHVEERVIDDQTGQRVLVTPEGGVSMHGAVVVLDVKTNEVRVLASNPGFNINDLANRYAALEADELNQPLIDRATSDTCEPGSTVKPLIGLGAITQGVLGATEPIDCTGYLCLPELGAGGVTRLVRVNGAARCWILSENPRTSDYVKQYGNKLPPEWGRHGPLTYSEALERSCDIFFETAADRLTAKGVDHWMEQFGLGRPTGIGIFERPGLRPDLYRGVIEQARSNNCLAGMGQGTVLATPLQIANEAATIARGGIWMRPQLLTADTQNALDGVRPRADGLDRVDLHLNPEALRQARIGMVNVVDAAAGTGKIDHPGFTLAAKTGTADTAPLWIKVKGPEGKMVNQKLMPVHRHGDEGPTPWYRSGSESGYGVVHSWYMGYAPVEDPQIAFCVLVEYAGAGGSVAAGPIANRILEACLHAGYLHAN